VRVVQLDVLPVNLLLVNVLVVLKDITPPRMVKHVSVVVMVVKLVMN
jgi:hypothetical protein